jgi:hypothetical protein
MASLAQHHAVLIFVFPAAVFPEQVMGRFLRFDQRLPALGAFSPLAQPGLGFGKVGKRHFVLLSDRLGCAFPFFL